MAIKYFLNEFKGRDKANLATKCILVHRIRIKLGMFRAKSKSRFILMDLNPRWLCLGSNLFASPYLDVAVNMRRAQSPEFRHFVPFITEADATWHSVNARFTSNALRKHLWTTA